MSIRATLSAVVTATLVQSLAGQQAPTGAAYFRTLEDRLGEDVVVCGPVAGTRTDAKGSLVLDLDRPSPNHSGSFRIPKPAEFGQDFAIRVLNQRVCAEGKVEWFDKRIAIKVGDGLKAVYSAVVTTPRPAGFGTGVIDIVTSSGIVAPRVLEPKPRAAATAAARKAERYGAVEVEAVFRADGTIGAIRVSRTLDFLWGLDDAALQAIRDLRFQPATRQGQPIDVITTALVDFQAKDSNSSIVLFEGYGLDAVTESPMRFQDVTGLRPIREVKPKYTPNAMRAKIQGVVELDVVVRKDGTVKVARVSRSLDRYGLDQAAIQAAEQWLFEPGQVNGTPVNALVQMSLEFRLH